MTESQSQQRCLQCGIPLYSNSNFCHKCGARISVNGGDAVSSASDLAREGSRTILLFNVFSMVNNFRYKEIFYDNLKISWFISDRKAPPVPFERVILNYAKLTPEARRAPENYILERFTLEEMDLLRQYLMTQNIRPMTEECKLPVTEKDRGYRDLQNMIGAEYLPLYTRNGYNLPFRTEGFFNVKTADERIEGDDERPTVISRVNFEEIRRLAKS